MNRMFTLLATDFSPHGCCYLWDTALIWLHAVSDALIGIAYVGITVTLTSLISRIRDIPFQWVYVAFAVFIVSCGVTHLMEVWNVWHADYWLAGWIKAGTALASVGTALMLPPLVPRAIALAEAARIARERGIKLASAHEELERLYRKTKKLDTLKTDFFANVSHELRTPLALVIGPTEKWLADPTIPPALRSDLEVVARNGRTLLKHVNDLLDVAKLEAGKLEPAYAQADAARIVRLVASHFEGLARDRNVTFAVLAPEALPAEVDPEKVERIALNLISNAFKFTPDGGRVRVSLDALEERARLEVADSGVGVRPELRESIFERFQQGDEGPSRRFGGTGLGLAIARDFARLLRGDLTVADAPEGGALFRLEVPLAAPAGTTVREPATPSPEATNAARTALDELRARAEAVAPGSADERPHVLVVEDNAEMSRFVADSLGGEFRVTTAPDGVAGLERLRALRPDVVVTDVMMPGMSGDELVRAARKVSDLDPIPIIVLTAKADDALRLSLLRDGAQDYLVKPFSVDELVARVTNLATIKRTREVLQRELESQVRDLERLAREVSSRKREVQAALETAQVAREYAERATRAKSDFLNLVSHELRTPLTTLLLQLERLQRAHAGGLTPNQEKIVDKMASSGKRLLDLVQSLLEVARLESGQVETQPEPCDVGALAREVGEELSPQAEEKGIALAVGAPVAEVVTDARLLRVVLANLVGNAIKFTDAGSVTVGVERLEDAVRVRVADTGPGIPRAKLGRIFEPFVQHEPLAHKSRPGMGLGLAIVRDLVRALGGTIEVSSDEGRGSEFRVHLPLRVEPRRLGS